MYNEELKTKFIKESITAEARARAAYALFNSTEPYEKEWGADICTRNKDELAPVLGELVGFRKNSQTLRLYILSNYAKWCIDNKVDGACDALMNPEVDNNAKFKRQMVANPIHLQRWLDVLYSKESLETVDCVHRCYCWLAYIGLREEEILDITSDDVDLIDRVVRFRGREYQFYNESFTSFKQCVMLTSFRYVHPLITVDVYKSRASGNKLLRGVKPIKNISYLRSEFSRVQGKKEHRRGIKKDDDDLDLRLSYFRIGLSGLFYRQYEAERAGMTANFNAAAEDFIEGKTYHLKKSGNTIEYKQKLVANSYMKDYITWKKVYNI